MSKSEIRVLHLIGGDLRGGAARGAYVLHRGLLASGVDSRVLSDSSINIADETVFSITQNGRGKIAHALRLKVDTVPTYFYPDRKKVIFSTGFGGYDFTKSRAYEEATIIHLHWVNDGFVNVRQLRNVKKPIIWTLRDMWPLTGGCHYSMGCENYVSNCGKCPQLNSNFEFDLSRMVCNSKKKYIPKSIKVVGISNWLSGLARESSLFKAHDVRTIFNNIDTQEFFPIEKTVARSMLGIETNKKIILIGAQSINDFYKGFDKFIESVRYLDKEKYYLCFFGKIAKNLIDKLGFDYNSYGFLHDTISLRLAYSAADVFVAPSVMDAFGKTLAEAMACGTPVVCFDATGPKDIVDHMVNGYRAISFEPEDLARGIRWVCHHQNVSELAHLARIKIVTSFDIRVIVKQYVDIYEEMLSS